MPRIYAVVIYKTLKIFGFEYCYKKQVLIENKDYFLTLDENIILKPKLKLKKTDRIEIWYNKSFEDAWYVD